MSKKIKQVLIWNNGVRNHLGQKVRTGKICAQLAHASINSYMGAISWSNHSRQIAADWMDNDYTKVVLKVETTKNLMDIYNKCIAWKIPCHLVTDIGDTEFNGIPTVTALGIGPYFSEEIDRFTRGLSLL
jgi:PTH2 family peptidyl-tRNA hydrolase